MASPRDTVQPALQAERDTESQSLRTSNPSVVGSPKADLSNMASTQDTTLRALEALKEDHERLQRLSVRKAERYTQAEEDNTKLQEENSELQGEISKLVAEKAKLREDKSKLRKELTFQRKDMEQTIDETSKEVHDFQEQVRILKQEVEQPKERQPEDTSHTTQLQAEINDLQAHVAVLQGMKVSYEMFIAYQQNRDAKEDKRTEYISKNLGQTLDGIENQVESIRNSLHVLMDGRTEKSHEDNEAFLQYI